MPGFLSLSYNRRGPRLCRWTPPVISRAEHHHNGQRVHLGVWPAVLKGAHCSTALSSVRMTLESATCCSADVSFTEAVLVRTSREDDG